MRYRKKDENTLAWERTKRRIRLLRDDIAAELLNDTLALAAIEFSEHDTQGNIIHVLEPSEQEIQWFFAVAAARRLNLKLPKKPLLPAATDADLS